MKKLIYIILLFSLQLAKAQVEITPHVLNSAGSLKVLSNNSNITVLDNVGEPFTNTIIDGAVQISQGFIQPMAVARPEYTVTALVTDLYCSGKNDGRISTAITTAIPNYSMTYIWTPTVVCPGRDCASIDSLKAGSYGLTVIFTYSLLSGDEVKDTMLIAPRTGTVDPYVLVVKDMNGPCKLKVFTGITVNGDGLNDHLFIENISEFPNNKVTIFNRWGAQLYQETGYDNMTRVWPKPEETDKLLPSTYFYVIEPGDGSAAMKGWVELIKN